MLSAAKPCDGNIVKAQAPATKAPKSLTALGFGRSRASNKVFIEKSSYLDLIKLQQHMSVHSFTQCQDIPGAAEW